MSETIKTPDRRLSFFSQQTNLFKVNNRNNGKRSEICSKLTIKTPERRL